MTIGTTMSCTTMASAMTARAVAIMIMNGMMMTTIMTTMMMIGATAGGSDPQLFHIIYWSVIAVACFIGFKLFRESDFH